MTAYLRWGYQGIPYQLADPIRSLHIPKVVTDQRDWQDRRFDNFYVWEGSGCWEIRNNDGVLTTTSVYQTAWAIQAVKAHLLGLPMHWLDAGFEVLDDADGLDPYWAYVPESGVRLVRAYPPKGSIKAWTIVTQTNSFIFENETLARWKSFELASVSNVN